MNKITKDEVLKLAELSRFEISNEEVDLITKQLQDVLSYALRVAEVAKDVEIEFGKNENVFAQDVLNKTNPEPILELAPDRVDNFFAVPKII